jgi:hypothetical protein
MKTSKASRQSRIKKIEAGMSKYYGNQPAFQLAGTAYSPAALDVLLEADIAASDAVDQARAVWLKAVEVQKATRVKTNPVLRAIRNKVLGDYGDTRDAGNVLADFEFKPRSTRKATGKEVVAAAEKRDATRKARGTMGKKEKQEIKGVVTTSAAPVASLPKATP